MRSQNETFAEMAKKPAFRDNRHALRDATKTAHDAAEASWTQALTTRSDEDGLLLAMQALHTSYGLPAAACSGLDGAVAQELRRLSALNADLHAVVPLRIDCQPPADRGADHAWGVLYALNGSAMGAAMMLRQGGLMADRNPAYMVLMHDFAKSGALGAFFRTLNARKLSLAEASSGARDVFAAMRKIARELGG